MSDTSMDISVKTINNESFSYTLPLTTIVSDLKRMLRDSTTIDIPRQRLIFRGRVLQDHLLLTDYSIACGNVLHMVARPTADTEAVDEAARNAMQSAANHPAATSSSYGIPQFSNEVGNLQGNQSVADGNQLQQLARNELELLDQLLSGQPQGQQEPDAALHSQHQHDLQRQQLFSSDISSYSFQSTSRFAVVPSSTSVGAPSSSSLAPTPFSPTTSTSPRPHVNSSSDSIERIRQGLLTIETIISTFEADTTASTSQPFNSRRISVPVTSTAANSNSETTSTIPEKSVRHSGSSLSNTADSSLSEANCVSDGVGIKVEDDSQLSNGNSILKDSAVFEKAAGVGISNSPHSTISEGQRETETETQITNTGKDDLGCSELSVTPIDVSEGAQESLCSPVEADLSSDSPSTAALQLNLKSELETEIPIGRETESGKEIETEALKGAVSEPDRVQLKEETPSRPRDSQSQGQGQRQREVKRQYFVGQWVDVKDTVSQWLEATVMMIDEDGQRVFIHYNGWPIRWDEWLPFMTARIAPFRTRTLHSPQHFHTLPIPNALNLPNVRSALPHPLLLENCLEEPKSRRPSVRGRVHGEMIEREKSRREREEGKSEEGTGEESKNGDSVEGEEAVQGGVSVDQDSILSLLPTIARMMRTLQPRIDAAARIAVQVLQPQDATAEDTSTASERDKDFKRIADELCPLADRFGRVLTDLSPLLRALGSTTAPALCPTGNGITTWGAQNPLSPDYFPAPEHPSNNMLEMSLASLLRPRAPSPPPLRAFRQPISTSAQPPLGLGLRSAVLLGGGSIGIGIDPQTQTPGVQGLGMQSLGGLRGTTRLGLGASGGGIFDIHIAVLPPSRRDGPNILNVSNPLHAPSAALSSVNADLATQSLIFVSQENIAANAPQTSSGETASALAPASALGRATVNSSSSSSSSRGVSNGVFPAPRPVPPSSSSVTDAGSTPSQLIVSDTAPSNTTPLLPPPLNPTLSTPLSPPGLPSVTSLILPGSSPPASDSTEAPPPPSSSSASLLNTSEAATNSTSEPLPAQNSSVAFSTWLDARREEREMEREIDRLRAMLRNREQEYEEAIRSILSLEGGAAGTSALARTGARADAAVVRDEGVVVGAEGSAEGGSGTGQSHTPASLPDISTMASSVDTAPSIRAQAVNDITSTAYSSREDSTFSNASQSSQEVLDSDLVNSARDSNNVNNTANSSQPHARGGIWRANTTPVPPSVIQPSSMASNISELAASEFADTDDTSMGTPSTVVGSESESTETGIATATTGMGGSRDGDGDGDGDRLTVECSSNSQSGSREGDDVPDSNTQASSSTYSDVGSPRSSVGVFQSTRHLGSSSLDSNADTNTSSGTCTDTCTKSSSQSDIAALANSRLDHAHANVIVLDGTRGSIEKVGKEAAEEGNGVEGGKETETAHVGCYLEKDFESLSSGSISAETIDAYIKLKDPSGKGEGNGAKLESGQLMRAMTEASEESKSQKGIMMEVAMQQRAAVLPLYGTVAAPKVPHNDGRQVPSAQCYSKASAPSSSSSSSSPSFTRQISSSTSTLMDGTQHSSSSTSDHSSAYIDSDITELLSAAKHDILQQIPQPSSNSSETLLLSSKLLKSKEKGAVECRSGGDEDVVEEKVEEGKNEEVFEREKEKHSVPSDDVGPQIVSAQGMSANSGEAGARRSSGSRILSGTLRRIRSSFSLFRRSSRAK